MTWTPADVRALQRARAPLGVVFETRKQRDKWMEARGHRLSLVKRLRGYRVVGKREAVRCETCHGTGRLPGPAAGRRSCPDCDGVGFVELGTPAAADLDATGVRPVADLQPTHDRWHEDDPQDPEQAEHGRHAVGLLEGPAGDLHLPAPRWVSDRWHLDPHDIANRLDMCGADAIVASTGAGLTTVPMHCRQALCPVCQRAAAGRRVMRTEPQLDRLQHAGCTLLHITLTQRAIPHGRVCGPVTHETGETLPAALDRWVGSFRAVRDAVGGVWRRDVAGYVYGVEWTERGDWWHVHGHVLAVVRPDADPARVGDAVVDAWLATPSGGAADTRSRKAQDWTAVQPDRVREVLKYPFKPAKTTTAGLLQILAGTKGRRLHATGGCLHGSSVAARIASVLQEYNYRPGWDGPPLTLGTIPGDLAAEVRACSRKKHTEPDEWPTDVVRAWPLALALVPDRAALEAEEPGPVPLRFSLRRPIWTGVAPKYWPTLALGELANLAKQEPGRPVWVSEPDGAPWETTPAALLALLSATFAAARDAVIGRQP